MASIDRRGDGWRVRWRERIGTTPEGGPIWRSRSRQCPTRRAADQVRREVEEASSLGRVWTPQAEQEVIDLRDGYARYLEHMVRAGRSRSTFDGVGSALEVLWEVLGAREGRPLPATLLNREVLGQVWQAVLDRKCAASTATRRRPGPRPTPRSGRASSLRVDGATRAGLPGSLGAPASVRRRAWACNGTGWISDAASSTSR